MGIFIKSLLEYAGAMGSHWFGYMDKIDNK